MMQIEKMVKSGYCLVLTFCCLFVSAQQNAKFTAPFGEIPKDGFYHINLPPDVLSKCRPGFVDIRLLDDKGKPNPYLLESEMEASSNQHIRNLPLLGTELGVDSQWHITIENPTMAKVSQLELWLKNASALRNANISGSDDKIHWYAISENVGIYPNVVSDSLISIAFLSIPVNNYRYFQLTLMGKGLLPIHIVKAGLPEKNVVVSSKYTPIPTGSLVQQDSSDKKSHVFVGLDGDYAVDKLELAVSGPKFFSRHISVFNGRGALLADGTISSSVPIVIPLAYKGNRLEVEIDNEDNAPLKVTSANCYQLNRYLLSYLESSKRYTLYFGDSTLAAPRYDIGYFKDSISKVVDTIGVDRYFGRTTVEVEPIKENNWVLWGCVGVGLFMLTLITLRMLKRIGG